MEFIEAGERRLAGDTARAATTDDVKDLRREASALKECVADLTLENRLLKKSMIADGGRRRMRYPASEKLESIRIVEQSHLPSKRTLDQLGIARRTFYHGTTAILKAALKRCRTSLRRRTGCGTVSRRTSMT
jgi:hypothetical protein